MAFAICTGSVGMRRMMINDLLSRIIDPPMISVRIATLISRKMHTGALIFAVRRQLRVQYGTDSAPALFHVYANARSCDGRY
jgi:dihydroorotase